ncbi:hypothetical protein RIF25_16715 [Thermosynechococcaceae cyanobacterium BACA0444]|uniref:Uncharacterized protein n=1 Tax=Pseudocalidococcus azoricus BACA0444 TaxID=2918990 RepID=A0AAE4FUI8_9CYAN|nr:hypothetical protein [Pseudocalidococcus azoricus]MDS3862441.1 hypothetical protein [Pseudocalidococcus azoricus BACA0444]
MSLSPMTRYYIRRMLQQNAVALGITAVPLPMTDDAEDSAFLDQLNRIESLTSSKLAELDLVVRLHQSLSRHGSSYHAYLHNLEAKLFSLMGLSLNSLPALEEPTLPLYFSGTLKSLPQPSISLADALAILNQVSSVARKYLGELITRNYWHTSRPHSSWFADYEVNGAAEILYRHHRIPQEILLTPEQLNQLQAWLTAFVSQCQRVLPQFNRMLQKVGLEAKVPGLG